MAQKTTKGKVAGLSVVLLIIASGVYTIITSLHAKRTSVTTTTGLARSSAQHPASNVSTVKPSPAAIATYKVAPTLPKYLKIPSIGVYARVLAVGLARDGAIGTPNNVFDTAWFDASAKPGQPGAMLIDGHISSWTSPGVFYHLTNLRAGSVVQVVRGDNKVFTYKVVKTIIYPSNNVDMKAVLSSVTPDKSGLNLISCAGDVIPGTSEFNERIVVFTQQV